MIAVMFLNTFPLITDETKTNFQNTIFKKIFIKDQVTILAKTHTPFTSSGSFADARLLPL